MCDAPGRRGPRGGNPRSRRRGSLAGPSLASRERNAQAFGGSVWLGPVGRSPYHLVPDSLFDVVGIAGRSAARETYGVRLRFLDTIRDPARRVRAREASLRFADPVFRAAAERVFFVIERVSGVPPSKVNLDAPVGPLVAGRAATDAFWERLEASVG